MNSRAAKQREEPQSGRGALLFQLKEQFVSVYSRQNKVEQRKQFVLIVQAGESKNLELLHSREAGKQRSRTEKKKRKSA